MAGDRLSVDNFEIGRLTDLDFEAVSKDLLEEILGVPLELFAPGADQGVDLRHFSGGSEEVVVQCKHWMGSGRAALMRHMLGPERDKIFSLKPPRYVLTTSVDLTRDAKNKLFDRLSPYVLSTHDLFGVRDIVSELQRRPHLVRRHLRLWLNSAEVLQSLLTKAALLRSQDLADDVRETLRVYVSNASYERASALLDKAHVCVIAGLPGIGKTTLAQVLVAAHLAEGYEVIEISEDVDEVNEAWDDEVAQIFYYDDFLGQSTLDDKLHKNEDNRLIRLLRRVSRSPNKRFILTTREYLLGQATQRYERLAREDFSPLQCVINMADYTAQVRAQILYNHVYFSDLAAPEKAAFANSSIYWPIINHPNFNPRLVEVSISSSLKGIEGGHVAREIGTNLSHPQKLWEHIVLHQLNSSQLHLIEMLSAFPSDVKQEDLELAWSSLCRHIGENADTRILYRSIHALEGTMVKVGHGDPRLFELESVPRKRDTTIGLHNPSVRDYMTGYIFSHSQDIAKLLASAMFFEQVEFLWLNARSDVEYSAKLTQENLTALAESMVRCFGAEPLKGRERDLAHRALILLQVARRGGFEWIATEVAHTLMSEDIFEGTPDGNDLVKLLSEMKLSGHPELLNTLPDVINDVVEWVVADMSDYANAQYAVDLLEQLGDLVPEEVLEEAEGDLRNCVAEEIDNWVRYRGPLPFDADALLGYATQYSNPEEVFPGYDSMVEAAQERKREMQEEQWPLKGVKSRRESQMLEIDNMFKSFRQ